MCYYRQWGWITWHQRGHKLKHTMTTWLLFSFGSLYWLLTLQEYNQLFLQWIPLLAQTHPLCQTDFHQRNSYVLVKGFLSCGRGWLMAKSYCNQPEMSVCRMSISTTPHWHTLTLYIRKPPKIAVSLVYCLYYCNKLSFGFFQFYWHQLSSIANISTTVLYSLPQGTSTYNTTIIR